MSAESPDRPSLDEFKQFIYGSYTKTHSTFADHKVAKEGIGRRLQIEAWLKKALPADKTAAILDFGCGDGLLLSVAQKLGYVELAGVDGSEALIERAARRTAAKLRCGDPLDYLRSCADNSFDAIVSFDVFAKLTRPELLETCRQVHRALKPGGRLLLHVPNGDSPYCGVMVWSDFAHERPHTLSSLEQILIPLGFDEIRGMEATPTPHGLISAVRAVLWQCIRAVSVFRLAVETGYYHGRLLTLNIFVTARKAD
jgi:SAM-dependent methyltransferase